MVEIQTQSTVKAQKINVVNSQNTEKIWSKFYLAVAAEYRVYIWE